MRLQNIESVATVSAKNNIPAGTAILSSLKYIITKHYCAIIWEEHTYMQNYNQTSILIHIYEQFLHRVFYARTQSLQKMFFFFCRRFLDDSNHFYL